MKTDGGPDDTPGVDMAAMMDCIFLLIIFFLVAATIRKKHNELPVLLPDAINQAQLEKADETVIVLVGRKGDGEILVGVTRKGVALAEGEGVAMGNLESGMTAVSKLASGPGTPIVVRAKRGLDYGTVSQVLGLLQANNYSTIDLDYQ